MAGAFSARFSSSATYYSRQRKALAERDSMAVLSSQRSVRELVSRLSNFSRFGDPRCRATNTGLPSHPGHKTAQEQMRAFAGMVSFRLFGGEQAAVQVAGRTRLFTLGESLDGVEWLIEHLARMMHASTAGSPLEVPADLIRLSVGIEDCDDLIDDLRQALSTPAGPARETKRPRLA